MNVAAAADAASAVQQAAAVKQSTAEEYEIVKARENLSGKTARLWYSLEKIWSNVSFFQRIIVFLTQLTVFIASASAVANGSMTIGELIALNGYAMLFFGPFVALGTSWQTIQNGLTAAGQLERIWVEKEEVADLLKFTSEIMINSSTLLKEIEDEK